MRRTTSKLLILLAASGPLMAQSITSTSSVSETGAKTASKKYTIGLSSTVETDTKSTDDELKYSANTTSLSGSYKFDDLNSVSASLVLDKELDGLREQKVRDPRISFKRRMPSIGKYITTSAAAGFSLPFSESSRKTTGLKTGLSLSGTLVYDATKHILPKLSVVYVPGVKANFHEYKISTTGSSNTQYTLSNALVFAYSISDKIALSLSNAYYRNFTYAGNYNDGFSFDQSLTFVLPQSFSATIGHAIGGTALAVNGTESNVQIFDEDLSTYYVSLGFSY